MFYNKNSLTGGFEPPTFRLTAERSADWATRANYTLPFYLNKVLWMDTVGSK